MTLNNTAEQLNNNSEKIVIRFEPKAVVLHVLVSTYVSSRVMMYAMLTMFSTARGACLSQKEAKLQCAER